MPLRKRSLPRWRDFLWNVWRADNTRVDAKAPFETWANAWFNAPCAFWHAPARKPVTGGKR